ncbi:phenylacetate--CoA ligase family protein [Kitasatospora sp. NBC_01266]|uniref:phenylacetate--CoA ligase family protein n=1 Tax=Kitasatospora sp. NBC_01266 TaxID=2903572 RepID=UPI002E2FB9A5|nr:hypothetical protein [Kitasatospora sp. NBC_01266]
MTAATARAGRHAKSAFRDQLLALTIDNARTVPFYQEHWKGVDLSSVRTVAELPALPTITKATLRESELSALRDDLTISQVAHSTGTTGRPFIRYRSAEELKALSDYSDAVRETTAQKSGVPQRRSIMFSAMPMAIHGSVGSTTITDLRLAVDAFSDRGLERTVTTLTRDGLLPQAERFDRRLCGNPAALLLITDALLAAGIDPAGLGIQRLVSLSDVLPAGQRRTLLEAWGGAELRDRFSLSELIGGATRCAACEAFHFDPTVVPEVLRLDADEPLAEGIGELTLTELFPFSQIQPMIRYRTGDLVQLVASDCEPGEVSIRLLGRVPFTPFVESGGRRRPVLSPFLLAEALERLPEVALGDLRGPNSARGALRQGKPLARLEWAPEGAGGRLSLQVATAFDPRFFAAEAAEFGKRVTALLEQLVLPGVESAELSIDVTTHRADEVVPQWIE